MGKTTGKIEKIKNKGVGGNKESNKDKLGLSCAKFSPAKASFILANG